MVNQKRNFEFRTKEEDFSCKKIIWGLYHLTPPWGFFELQVLDESSGKVLDSLSFSKNAESADKVREERESGEKRLYDLVEKIFRASCGLPYKYDISVVNGLGCDYTVRVYVYEEDYTCQI